MIGKNTMKVLSVSAFLFAIVGMTTGFQQPSSRPKQQKLFVKSSIETTNLISSNKQRNQQIARTVVLPAASTSTENDDNRVLDTEAIVKYAGAVAAQMLLFKGFFTGVDLLTSAVDFQVPFAANFFFFYVFSLKSRIFNPMSNKRPRRDTKEIEIEQDDGEVAQNEVQRKMPEWTPPGVVFPIMWILIIAPLRAASSAILVTGPGGIDYASNAILALILHLSIGDTWNTINNVERRYGTSVLGVACVWISAAFAAYSYGQVDPLAGKLLSVPLVWLTIASSLIVRTWQLNPSASSGEKESLLPTKPASQEGSITKLTWFEGKN